MKIQKRQSGHERIIQPFGNFVAQSLHTDDDIVHECAWLIVGCIDPGLGRNRWSGLGGVVAKNAASGDGPAKTLKHVVQKEMGRVFAG